MQQREICLKQGKKILVKKKKPERKERKTIEEKTLQERNSCEIAFDQSGSLVASKAEGYTTVRKT